MSFDPQVKAEFDAYARSYEAMHAQSVAASGDSPEYFAIHKQRHLAKMLGANYALPVLDFGCGIGNLTTHLVKSFSNVHGYDPSSESIDLAKERAPAATFHATEDDLPRGAFGAVVLANVLHHVSPPQRAALMQRVVSCVAPGGRVVVFEHNPFNPVTRRAVKMCPFDENAVLLSPREVKRVLGNASLTGIAQDYVLFFPRFLAVARPLEPYLAWCPLGAQTCTVGFRL